MSETTVDMNDPRSIMAECRRLRVAKGITASSVSAAAGLSPATYRNTECGSSRASVARAIEWLEQIRQMPESSNIRPTMLGRANAKRKADLTAPTDPRAYLERCLIQDEARLLFLQTQAGEVEKRIAQTRAALACFPPAEATE